MGEPFSEAVLAAVGFIGDDDDVAAFRKHRVDGLVLGQLEFLDRGENDLTALAPKEGAEFFNGICVFNVADEGFYRDELLTDGQLVDDAQVVFQRVDPVHHVDMLDGAGAVRLFIGLLETVCEKFALSLERVNGKGNTGGEKFRQEAL